MSLVTYERDGTTTPNPSGNPTAWLPDGTTGYRVAFRFIQATEGLISYNGLPATQPNYNAVVAHYPTYNDIIVDPNLAQNYDVDVACVVTGTTLRSGHSGLFTEIEAGQCDLSIYDEVGLFDPRLIDTVFGPGRRVRTGTWVQVSTWRPTSGWRPMFTGLVTEWSRAMSADSHTTLDANMPVTDVRVSCVDFFQGLANANFAGAVTQQLTSDRVTMLLGPVWSTYWGATSIAAGTVQLDARTLDRSGVLDQMKAAAAVEDGRVFIAPNGTFTWQTGAWRSTRSSKLTVLGIGAHDFRGELVVCSYQRIAASFPSYDSVKATYLIYDDMKVCSPTAGLPPTIPQVCASRMTAADTSEDVINEVVLSYNAPQASSGYVAATGQQVVANAPTSYSARDDVSIAHYGLQSIERSDLTPTPQTPTLPNLAQTLVNRWRGGDATITEITIDLNAEVGSHDALLALWSGDLINVVDRAPGVETGDEWLITTAEVGGMVWNFTPTRFDLALSLSPP